MKAEDHRDKIVDRRVYAQVSPKVEYSLTSHGLELIDIFEDLRGWGTKQGPLLASKEESVS